MFAVSSRAKRGIFRGRQRRIPHCVRDDTERYIVANMATAAAAIMAVVIQP
jgi:hypothetical protein